MRDILQNHIMQLLAFVTMEPPARFEAEAIRDEKVKLLRSIPPVRRRERDVVRGQYVAGVVRGVLVPGYREEADVSPDSMTETFVAMRLRVENWRGAGVPIVVRTGKRLARTATPVAISFATAPHQLFDKASVRVCSRAVGAGVGLGGMGHGQSGSLARVRGLGGGGTPVGAGGARASDCDPREEKGRFGGSSSPIPARARRARSCDPPAEKGG